MRSISEIKEEIAKLKEILADETLTAGEKAEYKEQLAELQEELKGAESKSEPTKEPVKEKHAAASSSDSEIQSKIAKLKDMLNTDISDAEKEQYRKVIEKLEGKLSGGEPETKTEAPSEKKGRGRPKKEKAEAQPKEKKQRGRPKKEKAASESEKKGRGRPKKQVEEKEEKPKVVKPVSQKKEKRIVVVAGKEYDLDQCDSAIAALKAREKQRKESGKKYKTKKPAAKAATNVQQFVDQIDDAVTKKAESNPKHVVATFKEFKKRMNAAFSVLQRIIPKTDVELLKKSLKEIDEIIDKYK